MYGYFNGPEVNRVLFSFHQMNKLLDYYKREDEINFLARALISISEADKNFINQISLPDNYIAIVLGGEWEYRTYNNWDKVIKNILNKNKHLNIVLLGSDNANLIAKKIILVHRRDEFRAAQHTVDQMMKLKESGKIDLYTNCQPKNFIGTSSIEKIVIEDNQKERKEIKVDSVLAFFGLKMELGPIVNWGLNLDNKTIIVDTCNFETNEKGIFAVGDICSYPGKLKLILCGFHEAALAAQECFKRAKPDERYVFRFTTSSSDIHKRLGVK